MADNPAASFDTLKKNVVESIQSYFPFEGRKQTVIVENVRVDDNLAADDIQSQLEAKDKEGTWGVPIKADIKLINRATGKVVDEKKNTVLARIPKLTNRLGFIVNGNEYQVDHLFRLKSGAYARVQENGDLETEFNLKKKPTGQNFSIKLDNKTKKFSFKIGDAHIPLYPVLKSVGISDDQLEHEWGKQIFDINKMRSEEKNHEALLRFWKKTTDDEAPPEGTAELARHVGTFLQGTEIRPDTTAITLGKAFTTVNGEALSRAATKILGVAAGSQKPDDRDSLAFKEVAGIEDFLPEKIRKISRSVKARLRQTVDHKETVGDVLSTDLFNKPIMGFFTTGGSVSERSEQTNPVQMLSASRKTTLIAPEAGGIKNENVLVTSMRVVNPSHLGFLDPMHTPESERTGITLHLGIGTRKKGMDLETPVFDHETGKVTHLTVPDFHQESVVLPDQVRWENGKPIPIQATMKVKRPGGDIETVSSKSHIRYVMPSAKGMFDYASNLIPFLPTDQGNRVSMADKQMEQAISLVHREAPLVQSKTDGANTFEHAVGHFVSQKSPVAGKVVSVKEGSITVADGKTKHEVQLYQHFPLNDPKGQMHSTPLVAVGDTVKAGQVLADTNFTRNGVLSIGTNLHVGYLPYKGYNYEDGIVISESAAKKLTSDHLYKKDIEIDPHAGDVISKTKYRAHHITSDKSMSKEDWDALDENGVIKPGAKVKPGQILIAAIGKNQSKDLFLKAYGKRALSLYKDKSLKWDEDHIGTVTRVVPSSNGKTVKVFVKTEEQAVVGDKLSGRHGNKGIITRILPDHEMPFTKVGDDRKPLDVLLNPSGVPTRINVGQILETAAGKIAEKTGKPYIVDNFSGPNKDYRQDVVDELKAHGLEDEEDVFDPGDVRKPLGKVLTGPQYLLKLKHQVEKKLTVRGGGSTSLDGRRLEYSADKQPSKGGEHGGMAFGQLDFYALLGHNARSNIREMSTYKSDQQDQHFWSIIQQGYEPPPPKPPFSYEKFVSLLKGLGVNVTKDGTAVRLTPMTNKEILTLAGNGKNEIKNALMIRSKDLKEEAGGLFDLHATGGKEGDKWSFIRLAEPMPNPIFVGQGNKPGPIPELLGLHRSELEAIIEGRQELEGKTGGAAIEAALKKIDVEHEIELSRRALPNLKGTPLDRANKKLKYLLALKSAGLNPHEAYMLHNIPVIPPKFRPPGQTPTGDLNLPPINGLYKNVIMINEQLKNFDRKVFSAEHELPLRSQLWDTMKALQSVGNYKTPYDVDRSGNRVLKGILDTIGGGEGEQPKEGYFQDKLIKRRQNLSIRSTIVPEPALHIDEVGLPRAAAMELYKPFVVAQLAKLGMDAMPAQQEMKKGTPLAYKALETVISERPLILKRDPVLHKFSVMAFTPKLVEGKAIQIHPLVTGGFNADFDGDAMTGTVPMSSEAVEEAKKMFPSKNLFSPTTGQIMYTPSQEALLGLHLLSKWGKDTGKTFADIKELDKAVGTGAIHPSDVVRIKGAFGGKPTTYGRILIEAQLPRGFSGKDALLHDSAMEITKKTLTEKITGPLVKNHESQYASSIDDLKNLGNEWSFRLGFSMGLKDLAPILGRDAILKAYQKKANDIKALKETTPIQDKKLVANWTEATKELDASARKQLEGGTNRLATMVYSGARGKTDQLRQMIAAPMLMTDSTNRTIPTPVTRSYSEGLDIGDYWLAQHGARKGTLQRAMGTSEPGAISKDVMNTTMSTLITSPDCHTKQGILMSLVPKEDDLTYKDAPDRYLAAPYKLKGGTVVKEGTLLTPEVISKLRNNKHDKVLVRSPLKCENSDGICAKCFGLNESGKLHDMGTNIGVLAGQAIGEPAVQMAMDAFHSGGIASSERGAKSVDRFTRLKNLIEMPKKLKDEATLAMTSGRISDIRKDPIGQNIFINGLKNFVPARLIRDDVHVGQEVKKGQPLSDGYINPRTFLAATKDIHSTQNYLVKEMHEGLYDKEGVRRRNIEVVIRALTNLTKIKEPGFSEFIHGDIAPRSVVEEYNRNLAKGERPIEHEPVLFGIKQVPGKVSGDWMSRLNYRELHSAVQQAAAMGQKSELHGSHPIPGIAFGAEFGKPPPGVKAKKPYAY
jgi:DNA-directed RNA polymerase subunit beta'